jgi:hypothetical protein
LPALEFQALSQRSSLQNSLSPQHEQHDLHRRALRQEQWSGDVIEAPGVNPPGVQHLLHHPRLYKPPEGDYAVVRSAREYNNIITQATEKVIFIRFHEDLRLVDLTTIRQNTETNLALAANVTMVLDCQGGAFISDPRKNFPKAGAGSFIDWYGCTWFGSGQGGESPAAAMRLSDVGLVYPCEVCS